MSSTSLRKSVRVKKSANPTSARNEDSAYTTGLDRLKPPKRTRDRVPPPQKERILQEYVAGRSIIAISKQENRNRETVAKIVHGPEIQSHVQALRARWFGLGPDAIDAVDHALTAQKDGRLAFQVLSSLGVIPSPEERQRLTVPLAETVSESEEAIKKVAAAILEKTIASDESLEIKSCQRDGTAKHESTIGTCSSQPKLEGSTRNRIPPPQRERILQEYAAGKSIAAISKQENRNRETVAKIVHGPEIQSHVQALRARFLGLGSNAIDAVDHALTAQKDGRLAFQVLSSLGVVPSVEERQRLTAPTTQTVNDDKEGIINCMAGMIEMAIANLSAFGHRIPELEPLFEKIGYRINYDAGKVESRDKKNAE
jgi:ethanolamine utilization microcompartment shell protein EutS